MGVKRATLGYPVTPQDIKNANDMFMTLFMHNFGNIDMADITDNLKSMLYRNTIQFPAEGNLDMDHPLIAKVYIPDNTKTIKSATISAITGKFRMDSSVTQAASIPAQTAIVKKWWIAAANYWMDHPTNPITHDSLTVEGSQYVGADLFISEDEIMYLEDNPDYIPVTGSGVKILDLYYKIRNYMFTAADYFRFQHNHEFQLPEHFHNQTPGIYESSVIPASVKIYVNGTKVGSDMNGVGAEQNNINIKDKLNIGAWNEIKVTAFNASRITLYGLADTIQQFS